MNKFLILPIVAILALAGCSRQVVTQAEVNARAAASAGRFPVICISGYKFTYGYYSRDETPVQILDTQGHGIPCETTNE